MLRKFYSIKLSEVGNLINHIKKIMEIRSQVDINRWSKSRHQYYSKLLLQPYSNIPYLMLSYETLITVLKPGNEMKYKENKSIDEYNRDEHSEWSQNTAWAFKAEKKFPGKIENKFCINCHLKSRNTNECRHSKTETYNAQQNQHNKQKRKN